MLGDLFPHHPLFAFTQRTRNLKEGTRVEVVLRGGDSRVRSGDWGGQRGAGTRPYGYLLEPHLLLAAVGFAAAVDLQRHDLPVAADVSEDLDTNTRQ